MDNFNELIEKASNEIPISKYHLDRECERNGSLYRYWGDVLAEEKTKLLKLKSYLKEIEAKVELDLRIGKIPKEYVGIKLTEKVFESLVKIDERVIKANDNVIEQERVVGKLSAIVAPFAQRKNLIDNEISLYLSGYYSEPGKKNNIVVDKKSTALNRKLNNRRSNKNECQEEEEEISD